MLLSVIFNYELEKERNLKFRCKSISKLHAMIAFTLAEVMITLGIIGIVAEITIPTLMNNVSDMQYKAAWKKNFANISNATNMIKSDNWGSLKSLCADNDNDCLNGLYAQKFSYTKICNSGSIYGICWHNNNTSYSLDGGLMSWDNGAGFVLADGTLLDVNLYSGNCSQPVGTINVCGTIHVDVNGFKGPNKRGKDIFSLWLLQDRVLPYGTSDGQAGSCNTSDTGASCATDYLLN